MTAWLVRLRRSAAVLLLSLLMALPASALQALDSPSRWSLTDQSGHRWGLLLLQQADPAYPSGWRLRLNALEDQPPLDHQRPLRLDDGQGGAWQLANRSEELVHRGEVPLPPAAAQFDAAGLRPAPSQFLPLRLQVPLASDAAGPDADLILGAQMVGLLRELALSQLAERPVRGM